MLVTPGEMLGLLGGGQLGRMFTKAAQSLGYKVTVLDPASESPAGLVADNFICADYADNHALLELSTHCAAITTEFENIPAESLNELAKVCVVSPDAHSVSIAQNRISEKKFLVENNFSVVPFAIIDNTEERVKINHTNLLPGILKICQFGYDGKGQRRVNSEEELKAAIDDLNREICVLERLMPLSCEISVIVARSSDGGLISFPVSENQHVNGILNISIIPARISAQLAQQAKDIAAKVAERLNYQGVLCVEFFVLEDGQLLINEIAPRPHNSGHYSIDACFTSQFEQQVRVMCGLPLGNTEMHSAAVMVNILGDLWQKGEPDWSHVLEQPSTKLHLYGKLEARPDRKMGHFTVLGKTTDMALSKAIEIKCHLEEHGNRS
ncbi:MAG: 5-(carboxyamino)imidazole ribonucleotide synthase [Nitrosomonadaceae bacterium]|nr:5-(carboxyamino)imidazole ribonucleotide synthase [Nitrosomonadaceae bacterium]|tara:strand:- start:699 stop:1844 length:1146 start_codon:yes stop_codon:yes gene_type:complete